MKKILLFLFLTTSIYIQAQNCNLYFDDDKKGNGDMWIESLSIEEFNQTVDYNSSFQFVLQNGVLFSNTNLISKEQLSTLLINYDFNFNNSIQELLAFESINSLTSILQYKIKRECNNTSEAFILFEFK